MIKFNKEKYEKDGKYAIWYPSELESRDRKYPVVIWANGIGSFHAGTATSKDQMIHTVDSNIERLKMEYTHHYDSPIGGIMIASDGEALTGLWFDGQKYFADTLAEEHKEKMLPIFAEADRWLDVYFSGKVPDFTPPLNMKTTQFRKAVWEIMLSIPYGKTMTYGEIADKIAKEKGIKHMSAQAVGGAVGHNAISLIIPCHRVVGTTGSLTGYAGGIEKKMKLLEMEGTDMRGMFVPKQGNAL